MMNEEAKQEVDRILNVGAGSATAEDIAFLTARQSYLTGEQKVTFGIVDAADATSDEAPAARRSRKASDEA